MKYYDEGWNAYILGHSYSVNASRDWQDGWKDCEQATIANGTTQDPI